MTTMHTSYSRYDQQHPWTTHINAIRRPHANRQTTTIDAPTRFDNHVLSSLQKPMAEPSSTLSAVWKPRLEIPKHGYFPLMRDGTTYRSGVSSVISCWVKRLVCRLMYMPYNQPGSRVAWQRSFFFSRMGTSLSWGITISRVIIIVIACCCCQYCYFLLILSWLDCYPLCDIIYIISLSFLFKLLSSSFRSFFINKYC